MTKTQLEQKCKEISTMDKEELFNFGFVVDTSNADQISKIFLYSAIQKREEQLKKIEDAKVENGDIKMVERLGLQVRKNNFHTRFTILKQNRIIEGKVA